MQGWGGVGWVGVGWGGGYEGRCSHVLGTMLTRDVKYSSLEDALDATLLTCQAW